MNDRKSIAIGAFFILVMLVTGLWRFVMLSDKTVLPIFFDDGKSFLPTSPARLLIDPIVTAIFIAVISVRDWLKQGDEEDLRLWRRRSALIVLLVALCFTLMHFSIIERSLPGRRVWDPVVYFRVVAVLVGVAIVGLCNAAPQLPWLSSKFPALSLSQENGALLLRRFGYGGILMGSTIVVAASFAPHFILGIVGTLATLSTMMLGPLLWCRYKLREVR